MTELEAIDLGVEANNGLGDPLRVGGAKINENFTKLFVLARVTQSDTLQVFKAIGNENDDALEVGDLIMGWFTSTQFIKAAIYNGGPVGEIASYNVIDDIPFD